MSLVPAQVGLLGATLAALGAERMFELWLNRQHAQELRRNGAVWIGKDGFGLILLVQVLLVAGLVVEGALAPWSRVGWWTWALLAAALLLQGLRYWVIATLGWRWTIRVATVPGSPRIVRGPYRFLRHPNYVVVALETLVLPLAFACWGTLLVVLPLNLVALRRRIRLEERALRALPGG